MWWLILNMNLMRLGELRRWTSEDVFHGISRPDIAGKMGQKGEWSYLVETALETGALGVSIQFATLVLSSLF